MRSSGGQSGHLLKETQKWVSFLCAEKENIWAEEA